MHPTVIQEIFRFRHILVTDVPSEKMEFNDEGLSKAGSLSRVLEIQGKGTSVYLYSDITDTL